MVREEWVGEMKTVEEIKTIVQLNETDIEKALIQYVMQNIPSITPKIPFTSFKVEFDYNFTNSEDAEVCGAVVSTIISKDIK